MPSVIASGAKQSHGLYLRDCFAPLAMTKENVREPLPDSLGLRKLRQVLVHRKREGI